MDSIDQNTKKTISRQDWLVKLPDLADPFCLAHNVLFSNKGFIEQDPKGLEIQTNCQVPMGSGLGTSSILAGALVKAIWKYYGQAEEQEKIFNHVLLVEQLMGADGGWQDQVGGLVPGLKITSTSPGVPQRFEIQKIDLSPRIQSELEKRLLLVYTGQQRVAKNILEVVVLKWLSRETDLVNTLKSMPAQVDAAREAIVSGDFTGFGKLLTQYFEAKKVLNPKTINSRIEDLISRVASVCNGWSIAGAGGGGFVIFLLKESVEKEKFYSLLESSGFSPYDWSVANL